MRKNETITAGDLSITVQELTVTQIDELFASFALDRQATMAEQLLDSPIPIEVVAAATGLSSKDLNGKFSPSELHEIWAATARVNSFLSAMIGRVAKILPSPMPNITEPASDGSSAG